jgi:hypothetical protein
MSIFGVNSSQDATVKFAITMKAALEMSNFSGLNGKNIRKILLITLYEDSQ